MNSNRWDAYMTPLYLIETTCHVLGLLVGRVLMYKLSKTDSFFSGDLLYFCFCSHIFQTATLL
jgi:hypothetical protein